MKFLLEYEKYSPEEEYKSDSRRSLNLDLVRKTVDYKRLIELGLKEDTSHQQEINNTLKFVRTTTNTNDSLFLLSHRKPCQQTRLLDRCLIKLKHLLMRRRA